MPSASDDEQTKKYVSGAVLIFLLTIGVPVWWKTTEVYRAVLPIEEIQSLYQIKQMPVSVDVIFLNKIDSENFNDFYISLEKSLNTLSPCESLVTFNYGLADNNCTSDKPGQVLIEFEKAPASIQVTSERKILVSAFVVNDIDKVQLVSTIKNVLVNEQFLCDAGQEIFDEVRQETANSVHLQNMVKQGSKFELLFSLWLTNSEKQVFDWNVKEAIDRKLAGFLHELRNVYEIDVTSQILFANPTYFHPKKLLQDNSSFYYVTKDQLSQAVNKIEGRLGSQISSDPTLSMVVHVVDSRHKPLHILKEEGKKSATNSFLIPRWGSMIIYNTDAKGRDVDSYTLNVEKLMPMFVGHLRMLLSGLDNKLFLRESSTVKFEPPKKAGITKWELDLLYRLKVIKNVASAVHSLHSLEQLLNKINDIVINDGIAEEIFTAVDSIKQAKTLLRENDLLPAIEQSKIAFKSAEKAFFDPTLMELLYFPEDQKFAIYCPLFIPIGMTVLVSAIAVTKATWRTKVKSD